MGKPQDLDRGSSVEYQSLDAPWEKRQQKAAALTLMGGSLPGSLLYLIRFPHVSVSFLLLQVLQSVTDAWAQRQRVGLKFQSCLGTSC